MEAATAHVSSVPLFQRLDTPLQYRIEAVSAVKTVEADAVLAHQGQTPDFLHVLLEGQVALTSAAGDGSTAVVEVLHPFGHFVLASVVTQRPSLMTARAITRSRLLTIGRPALLHLIQREPSLAHAMLRAVSYEYRDMVRQVRDLKLRTAAQRLGCYLLELANNDEVMDAKFRLPLEKGLLAARLGCRQENLSRAFATLRAYGVETHGSRVILHDIPRLRALAVPDNLSDYDAA
jgi:CRP/FNR family transcriptional activator FtrB